VMRITGNDPTGTNELSNFIDPESPYPVIVTTSQLLSTGVDIRTCRLIVLDREIGSMTEFKQIVGRGTRIHEDSQKYYFTLVDFRKATNHFADKDFDGDPVQIYEPGEDDPPVPPEPEPTPTSDDVPAEETVVVAPPPPPTKHGVAEPRAKLHVRGRPVTIYGERVEYIDENGKLITESLRDYTRATIRKQYASLDVFLRSWNAATAKGEVLKALDEEGMRIELLQEEFGTELDPFDLICHIAYDAPPLTRKQRAAAVRKQNAFAAYEPQARRVLEVLLDKYQDEGVVEIDNVAMLRIPPLNQLGSIAQLIKPFGNLAAYQAAVQQMQQAL
jgi:type I restriction enzyme, R subunit